MLLSPPLSPQAPTRDSLVSLSGRISSSPDSSENLSEIPLSHRGAPPAQPVILSLAPLSPFQPSALLSTPLHWAHPLHEGRHQCPERTDALLKDAQSWGHNQNEGHVALGITAPSPLRNDCHGTSRPIPYLLALAKPVVTVDPHYNPVVFVSPSPVYGRK